MREYILMLKKLRKVFDNVEIRFQKDGFSVDTTRRKLQAYKAQITYEKETLEYLGKLVPLIREEIISLQE